MDNDPMFSLTPMNIPLVHPQEAISLKGDEQQIQWEAKDRHGFAQKCATKLEFLEAPNFRQNGENSEENSGNFECPDAFTHGVNASGMASESGKLLFPAEYPPLKFTSSQGNSETINLR